MSWASANTQSISDTQIRAAITGETVGRKAHPIVAGGPEDLAGIVDGDIADWNQPAGNVLRYGSNAVPGATDMAAAIQAALDTGLKVVFPDDADYYCSSNLSRVGDVVIESAGARVVFAAGKSLSISGVVDAGAAPTGDITALDSSVSIATAFDPDDILWIEGDDATTPAANLTLSTIAIRSAVNITADAAVFAAGDVGKNILVDGEGGSVFITSFNSATDVDGYISNNNPPASLSYASGNWTLRTNFCPSRPYYERGELARVLSYAAGTAQLESRVIEGYVAADCRVYRIQPSRARIKGLRLSGDVASDGVLNLNYCSRSRLERVEAVNAGATAMGVLMTLCFDTDVEGGSTDAHYGVMWHGCQDCRATGGRHFTDAGHAVEFSAGAGTPPSRRIAVSDLTAVANDSLYAINSHGGASEITVSDCMALGGIALYGQDCAIRDCRVSMPVAGRDAVRLFSEVSGEYMEASNIAIDGQGAGVVYKENYAAVGAKSVTIRNIGGIAETGVQFVTVSDYAFVPFTTREFSVDGCSIEARTGNCLVFDAGSKASSTDADRMRRVSVISNPKLLSDSNRAIYFRGNSAVVKLDILNNGLVCGQGDNGWDLDGARYVTCRGNRSLGQGTGGASNVIGAAVEVGNVAHNSIENFVSSRGLSIAATDTRASYVADNEYINVSGAAPTLDYYATKRINSGQNVETRAGAAPTTGTWAVGDIVWHDAPTAGGTAGWVCTTAGTPGTWKTFGAIAA